MHSWLIYTEISLEILLPTVNLRAKGYDGVSDMLHLTSGGERLMTTELTMLTWVAVLTVLIWIPYVLAHISQVGIISALTYRSEEVPPPAWASRAKKAHINACENLIPFAILVLVAHDLGISNSATTSASVAYLVFRVAHFISYITNVPFARTISFLGSWGAQLCIASQLIGPFVIVS